MRQAAILVGGFGTRLGSLTAKVPKPLLPVGDRPFLAWLLRELCRYGVEEILLLAGHLADAMQAALPALMVGMPRPIALRLLREPAPSGTGGALFHARAELDEKFLLCNGDTLVDAPLAPLLGAALADPPDVAGRLLVVSVPAAGRYGAVLTDGETVRHFQAAASGDRPALVHAGVGVLSREALRELTPVCSLEQDVLPGLAKAGRLRATATQGWFVDIGVPHDLARARAEMPGRLHRSALFLDRDGVLNEDSGYVGTVERLHWTSGAREAVAMAHAAGWHVFVVTNQSGVARGLYDETAVAALHRHMQTALLQTGGTVDDWRHCPHHPQGVVARYAVPCACRKPAPGMLHALLRDWEVASQQAVLIGDRSSDLDAAAAAGMAASLFAGGDLRDWVAPLLVPALAAQGAA